MKTVKLLVITSQILISILLFTGVSFAQKTSIYIPRNIVKAYEKGTRSYDGKPGSKYWVNHTDYKIQAEVFPKDRIVKGTEHIKYYNDSPDTITNLVMRLYLDINKKGNSRDSGIDPSDETDGVKIDTLMINGVGVTMKQGTGFLRQYGTVNRTATNLIIRRNGNPIFPNTVTTIDVQWSVVIPKISRDRMGAYNDSTLYVAYWYPQVSVYDDIDGWDRNEFGGIVEFYNDKNNFEYEVTAPKNYVVWGTGLYQNIKDVLKPEIYGRFQKAHTSDTTIRIVREEDLLKGVTTDKEKNVWKFKADGVPDIAFATSSGYAWDGLSTKADETGKRVFVDVVYPVKAKGWVEMDAYAKITVESLSTIWPGIPFPYPKVTIFNGDQFPSGAMEIPMMCNNSTNPTKTMQISDDLHEIAHTYFPFYMGTNERKYEWMDEGWATFFTNILIGNHVKNANELVYNIQDVSRNMGIEDDVPIIYPSVITRGGMLVFSSYAKAGTSYWVLKDLLGDDLFKKALQEYIKRWNGKHPIPWDFFYTFNDVAKEDLSWFWNPWYFESGFPDLAVQNVKVKGKSVEITVEKIGNVPVPVDLIVSYADGSKENIHRSTTVWRTGNKELVINLETEKKIEKVSIDTFLVPDVNPKNNVFVVNKQSK